MTSCASSTDEPFVAWTRGTYMDQGKTQTTINVLQQCGYSDNAQQACLSGAMEDYSAWTQTPIDFPFSIYQVTDADIPPEPKLSTDPGFTAAVMQLCANAGNCILSSQALRNPNDTSDEIVYTSMAHCIRWSGGRLSDGIAGKHHRLVRNSRQRCCTAWQFDRNVG